LRISIDTKATVRIGQFSRGGKNRITTKASDHDFQGETITPLGIFLPKHDELSLWFTKSKTTSDFIVDSLEMWWNDSYKRFSKVNNLVINLDNGPESNSRRTQFMKRIVDFAEENSMNIKLAYYPPYHSKYNLVERCWGILEQHWNGSLLDSAETTLEYAKTMTWNGKHPHVTLNEKTYEKGVRLTKKEMILIEDKIDRLPKLEKYFVNIPTNI
jgi:hypothetical protein